MIRRIALLLVTMILTSCAQNTFRSTELDPSTGEYETFYYSKYFDAGDWIIEDKLGVKIVIDVEAIKPDSHYNDAKITIYFLNFDTSPIDINVYKINVDKSTITSTKKREPLPAESIVPWEAGRFEIFYTSTEEKVVLSYYLNGVEGKKEFNLKRRTTDELKKYFGPNGKAPYPWVDM